MLHKAACIGTCPLPLTCDEGQQRIYSLKIQVFRFSEERKPVDISVVLWYEVDIVEDDTGPVVVLHRLDEANVEEHRPVEWVWIGLVDKVDSVVDLLSPVFPIMIYGSPQKKIQDYLEIIPKYKPPLPLPQLRSPSSKKNG